MFFYFPNRFLERLVTNMSSIHLPRLRVRTAIAIWSGVGFVGGAISLFAILSIVLSRGLLPGQWAVGSTSVGLEVLEFIAGVSLCVMALWGIYSKASSSMQGAAHN
jgi:hypothetical protein